MNSQNFTENKYISHIGYHLIFIKENSNWQALSKHQLEV